MTYDRIQINEQSYCLDKTLNERLIQHKIDISENKSSKISIEKVYNYMISYVNVIADHAFFYDDFNINATAVTELSATKLYNVILKNIYYEEGNIKYISAVKTQSSPNINYSGLQLAIAETLNSASGKNTKYRYGQHLSEEYKALAKKPKANNILLTPKMLYIGFSSIEKDKIYTDNYTSSKIATSIANIDTIHTILLYLYTFLGHIYKFSSEFIYKSRSVSGKICIGSTRYEITDGYSGYIAMDYHRLEGGRICPTGTSPMFSLYDVEDSKRTLITSYLNDHTLITPYREVRDSNKSNIIYYFRNSTTHVSAKDINRYQHLNNLIYIAGYTQQNKTFDETLNEGTNGKFQLFNVINITENQRMDIQKIFELFNLKSEKLITLDNIKAAIDFIFDDWFSNMNVFNCTYYSCHYNCHGNSTDVTANNYDGHQEASVRDPEDNITISFKLVIAGDSPLKTDQIVENAGWPKKYSANLTSLNSLDFTEYVYDSETKKYYYNSSKPTTISTSSYDDRFDITMRVEDTPPPETAC